jgi:hypothetical protein
MNSVSNSTAFPKSDISSTSPSATRREFVSVLGALGGIGLAALARNAQAATLSPLNPNQRRNRAFQIRHDQAQDNRGAVDPAVQPTNGDEEALLNRIGNYSKGLPHNSDGEVALAAYNTLRAALSSGDALDFENITLGGSRKLTNPQGGFAFEMEGGDGPSFVIPAPPSFSSRETAAEIAENYWMARLRDVPFSDYPSSPIADAAAADLNRFGADAKVAKNANGRVTPRLLFRGLTPGDADGPYLSQFFYLPCPFGANDINQRTFSPVADLNYLTNFADFVAVQNGGPSGPQALESIATYMRNGRAIGEWVHIDVLFQAYFMAFLVLASMNAPLDAGNPYANSRTQIGFATFGGPHIATVLCEVSTRALHATWYQKWFAHRRLRPEAYAGAVHARLYRGGSAERFPVHEEILSSLGNANRLGGFLPSGNALLPQAFPEGSPTHPAYTAGHATVAGACTTILKAFFDESWVIPRPVQPSADGLSLLPLNNALTVGGELNKIASNVALGRNIAGVHWRSDATQSLLLGERIAIQLLREHNQTFNEPLRGMSLTKFDGTVTTI